MEVDGSQVALESRSGNDYEKNDSSGPVVYQLVRVEGDGTLVPATEDDVLQFEHFLDEKGDLPSIEDVVHRDDFVVNDHILLNKPDLEGGSSKSETSNGQTQKLDADLEENRLQSLDDSLDLPLKSIAVHDQQPDRLNTEEGDNNVAQQDNASTETAKSTVLNDTCGAEKEKADACSSRVNDSSMEPSVSGVASLVPDFSILRGEVCLDDLTIRELQDAFRATFGRETTVKDKLWLKRRITMGLTNSCDVPSSGCVVKDYKIVGIAAKQEQPTTEGKPKVELEPPCLVMDQELDPGNEMYSPSTSYYQSEDQQGYSKRLKRVPTDNDKPQGPLLEEQGAAKRLRKPTKRYIEELSDIETHDSTGKLSSPGRRPAHDEVLLRPRLTPFQEVDSLSTTNPTREDTFGGFSVHIPYASRIRRGRPRRNFVPFLDPGPSVECNEVQMEVDIKLEEACEQKNHIRKSVEMPLMKNPEKKGGHTEATDNKKLQTIQANDICKADDPKPKTKRSLKRKHHRAWTLSEVLKLVDGVARFGPGKWSEIRRLSFASYSYRTSVDLKDKWRNLIRASQTKLSTEKDGGCPRKNNPSIVPIPPSILLRVKELAELQPQAGDLAVPIKFPGQSSKVVQGKGSGFL